MMNLARKMLKSLAALLGVILIIGFVVYGWWLRPYFTTLNMGQLDFSSEETISKGFPFDTVLHIKEPRIHYNNAPFWVGEEMRLEWSLSHPTRITIHLNGEHVISANLAPNMRSVLQLHNTSGYVHLESLRQMQLDVKGERINIQMPSSTGQMAPLAVEKLYLFYDGPTSLKTDSQSGDLHFSAENITIPPYMRPPFKKPIERLDFKAIHNKETQSHDIKNIVLFWDSLRAAGNGVLKHDGPSNEGDFIIATQGIETLIGGMYKAGRFTPQQIHNTVRAITNYRVQQQRSKDDPIYLPVLYKNNTIKIAGIPFYTLRKSDNVESELQRLITGNAE